MSEKNTTSFRERVSSIFKPGVHARDNSLKGSFAAIIGSSEAGVNVTEESSLSFAAVWQARRILSEIPASLPLEVFEENGQNRTPVDHRVKELLQNPNPYMNAFSWREIMNDRLQAWGNGVSVVIDRQLIPVSSSGVEVKIDGGRLFYIVNDETFGIKKTFFADEVVHFRGFSSNGLWGKSPISAAKDNIGLGLAAERFGARFFKKGGNLKSVIETSNHLSDKEFEAFKSRWNKYYRGESGDHETPVLEYGMTYKALGIPPEDAQFLQTRQFSIQDVARWFNLPPHMLGDLSRSTFSNIEHQDLQFVKYTLRPILKRQEMELEEKLLLPGEKGKIRIRFNIDGLLRGDLASVTNHIKEMYQSGVINKDEARALLNRNSVAGGSEFLTPANITGKTNNDGNK
jgi:HK97 family phage portal protein